MKPVPASTHLPAFYPEAHSDFAQTSEFIDKLRPAHVILVHGGELC